MINRTIFSLEGAKEALSAIIMYSDPPYLPTVQWWTGLGEAGADNVVIMPGVSLIEAEQFVDILYVGQNVISNEHFTVIEDTGITEEFVCNNNSDCEDVKLEPYEIYDQVFV